MFHKHLIIGNRMKLPFLNRHSEMKRLHRTLDSPESRLIIIYGRRRCGKSTLIRKILKDIDVYCLSDQSEKRLQIMTLVREI